MFLVPLGCECPVAWINILAIRPRQAAPGSTVRISSRVDISDRDRPVVVSPAVWQFFMSPASQIGQYDTASMPTWEVFNSSLTVGSRFLSMLSNYTRLPC